MIRRLGMVLAVAIAVPACGADGAPEGVRLNENGRHYAVTVVLDSASTGVVEVDVRIDDIDGGQARVVSLSAVMPNMGHAMPEVPAEPGEPGRFHASGELFGMAGVWDLAVRVDGDAGAETITFPIVVER